MKCTCVNKECNKTFDADPDIVCPHCNKTQKINNSIIASLIFAGAVGVGGYQMNNLTSPNRYPTNIEYSLINRCLNDDQYISTKAYQIKFKRCVDAFEKARDHISYSSYKKNPNKFNKIFEKYFLTDERTRN
ncbi:hypothetical protein [Frischella perrara]|uniref:hypothetical protein n=1 Tax=Frischella perrara TaxID=1267021 RepID=UPI0023F04CE1|nr:hypothetical protein [Frischella perrara]